MKRYDAIDAALAAAVILTMIALILIALGVATAAWGMLEMF
jgi:hypothetical protein